MYVFVKWVMFFGGLILFGLGNAIAVEVQFLGLHPWEVLNVALFERFGFTIGTWSVLCGFFLVMITLVMDRKYISLGTFLNALLIGPIMDFFLWTDMLPKATHSWLDYLIIFGGIMLAGTGGGLYVASGAGAGPRDGFMLSISDKTGLSVSKARIIVESVVLVIGFILGGPVFVVSFLYTFIQSPIFQRSFHYFRSNLERLREKTTIMETIAHK
ncbi:hypothetical protein [Bacillus sp. CECT 9360]|uniref:YczE/YyaS/YitT family protein n=1 Tax=Bacillus sp. CECT 9360 TaxID=2845821 RepID=UPI001E4FFD6F|nr:hypothetical protein [Bacillus sp. CECT 9360]CAH0344814.1 hypothetical protein BCI9360_01082 [Bacillus sp. CECT 9360]